MCERFQAFRSYKVILKTSLQVCLWVKTEPEQFSSKMTPFRTIQMQILQVCILNCSNQCDKLYKLLIQFITMEMVKWPARNLWWFWGGMYRRIYSFKFGEVEVEGRTAQQVFKCCRSLFVSMTLFLASNLVLHYILNCVSVCCAGLSASVFTTRHSYWWQWLSFQLL